MTYLDLERFSDKCPGARDVWRVVQQFARQAQPDWDAVVPCEVVAALHLGWYDEDLAALAAARREELWLRHGGWR